MKPSEENKKPRRGGGQKVLIQNHDGDIEEEGEDSLGLSMWQASSGLLSMHSLI